MSRAEFSALHIVQCAVQCAVNSIVYSVQFTVYHMHYTLYSVVYSVQCTLYIVHCHSTVYSVHCVYSLQCTVQRTVMEYPVSVPGECGNLGIAKLHCTQCISKVCSVQCAV